MALFKKTYWNASQINHNLDVSHKVLYQLINLDGVISLRQQFSLNKRLRSFSLNYFFVLVYKRQSLRVVATFSVQQ